MRYIILVLVITLLIGSGVAKDPHTYNFNLTNDDYINGIQDGLMLASAVINQAIFNDETALNDFMNQLSEYNETYKEYFMKVLPEF